MQAKLGIIGLIWLFPLACWFGVPPADGTIAVAVGTAFACLMSLFVARQPMLRCGGCGAATAYFDHYTPGMARWHGNRRRYFVCRSCAKTIDRVTGMPVEGVPDTPVALPLSRVDIGRGVSGLGCLMIFASFVIGSIVVVIAFQGAEVTGRSMTLASSCVVTAVVGVTLVFAGRAFQNR